MILALIWVLSSSTYTVKSDHGFHVKLSDRRDTSPYNRNHKSVPFKVVCSSRKSFWKPKTNNEFSNTISIIYPVRSKWGKMALSQILPLLYPISVHEAELIMLILECWCVSQSSVSNTMLCLDTAFRVFFFFSLYLFILFFLGVCLVKCLIILLLNAYLLII